MQTTSPCLAGSSLCFLNLSPGPGPLQTSSPGLQVECPFPNTSQFPPINLLYVCPLVGVCMHTCSFLRTYVVLRCPVHLHFYLILYTIKLFVFYNCHILSGPSLTTRFIFPLCLLIYFFLYEGFISPT